MKVSVQMITYNHERFIAQAIDSVLMQESDFPYELVIGEDCSTDGTREIVVKYARMHPGRIRLLLSEENLGGQENARRTRQACQGQYIAVLEGDDYWTSPHKLQKQADFLDSHPECAMCFHDLIVFYEDGSRTAHKFCSPNQSEFSTVEDLLESTMMQTCSTMRRAGLITEVPEWYYKTPLGDWAWNILTVQHGKIGYINEVMGVYRIHSGGMWAGQSRIAQLEMQSEFYELVDAYLGCSYDRKIRAMIARCDFELACEHYLAGRHEVAAQHMTAAMGQFQDIAHRCQGPAINTAWQIEAKNGGDAAREFIAWIHDAVRSQPLASRWMREWWGEWYAGHAFRAHQSGDSAVVRRSAWRAVGHNPQLLRNLGLVSIGVSAVAGSKIAAVQCVVRWLLRHARNSSV